MLAPAQAWEFSLRNTGNILFYGELKGEDVTGEIRLRALCRRAPGLDMIVRLDAMSPDPYFEWPDATASVTADGGAPVAADVVTQAAPSFTATNMGKADAQRIVDEIGRGRGEVKVAWGDTVATFDATDAALAVKGFLTICDNVPVTGRAVYGQ